MNRYVLQAYDFVANAEVDLRLSVNLLFHGSAGASSLVLSLLPTLCFALKSLIIAKQQVCARRSGVKAEGESRSLDFAFDDWRQAVHKHPRAHSRRWSFVSRLEFTITEKSNYAQRLKDGIADNSIDLICTLAQVYIQVRIVQHHHHHIVKGCASHLQSRKQSHAQRVLNPCKPCSHLRGTGQELEPESLGKAFAHY